MCIFYGISDPYFHLMAILIKKSLILFYLMFFFEYLKWYWTLKPFWKYVRKVKWCWKKFQGHKILFNLFFFKLDDANEIPLRWRWGGEQQKVTKIMEISFFSHHQQWNILLFAWCTREKGGKMWKFMLTTNVRTRTHLYIKRWNKT